MTEDKETSIVCGSCVVKVGEDEKGRPTLTPECTSDEVGKPIISEELKVFFQVLQGEEVVVRPAKIKNEE